MYNVGVSLSRCRIYNVCLERKDWKGVACDCEHAMDFETFAVQKTRASSQNVGQVYFQIKIGIQRAFAHKPN